MESGEEALRDDPKNGCTVIARHVFRSLILPLLCQPTKDSSLS